MHGRYAPAMKQAPPPATLSTRGARAAAERGRAHVSSHTISSALICTTRPVSACVCARACACICLSYFCKPCKVNNFIWKIRTAPPCPARHRSPNSPFISACVLLGPAAARQGGAEQPGRRAPLGKQHVQEGPEPPTPRPICVMHTGYSRGGGEIAADSAGSLRLAALLLHGGCQISLGALTRTLPLSPAN